MIYCIIAFIGVFVFLMISLVISTKRRIIKFYYMEIEPIKLTPKVRDTDYPNTEYILTVKFEELYDLSEIIQFLSKNHPDIKIIHEIW